MASRLVLDGVRELKDALRHLPVELRDEAAGVVRDTAEHAATTIRALYPIGPGRYYKKLGFRYEGGDLRAGIKVVEGTPTPFGVSVTVASTAKIAWIYENGTELRHTATGTRGRMPASKVVIPTAIRERRAMYTGLAALLRAHGLTVG